MVKASQDRTTTVEQHTAVSWQQATVRDSMRCDAQDSSLRDVTSAMKTLADNLVRLQEFAQLDPCLASSIVPKSHYHSVGTLRTFGVQLGPLIWHSSGSLISGADDGKIRLWSQNRQSFWGDFKGLLHPSQFLGLEESWGNIVIGKHGHDISSLIFLKDGRLVSAGIGSHEVRIWSATSQKEWQGVALRGHTSNISVLVALFDDRIVSGAWDGTLRIWKAQAPHQWTSSVLQGHSEEIYGIHALRDGRIISSSNDLTIRIWSEQSTGEWTSSILAGHEELINDFIVFPNDQIISASEDQSMRVWTRASPEQWTCQVLRDPPGGVNTLQALPNGDFLSGGRYGALHLWSLSPSGYWQSTLLGSHEDRINSIVLLPDGRVVTASDDCTICIWERPSATSKLTEQPANPQKPPAEASRAAWKAEVLRGHSEAVVDVAILSNGRMISQAEDKCIRLWDGYIRDDLLV